MTEDAEQVEKLNQSSSVCQTKQDDVQSDLWVTCSSSTRVLLRFASLTFLRLFFFYFLSF